MVGQHCIGGNVLRIRYEAIPNALTGEVWSGDVLTAENVTKSAKTPKFRAISSSFNEFTEELSHSDAHFQVVNGSESSDIER